jgi:hypothetical protein
VEAAAPLCGVVLCHALHWQANLRTAGIRDGLLRGRLGVKGKTLLALGRIKEFLPGFSKLPASNIHVDREPAARLASRLVTGGVFVQFVTARTLSDHVESRERKAF